APRMSSRSSISAASMQRRARLRSTTHSSGRSRRSGGRSSGSPTSGASPAAGWHAPPRLRHGRPGTRTSAEGNMIIDCHGHYTTAPKALQAYRDRQIEALKDAALAPPSGAPAITDDEIRASLEG